MNATEASAKAQELAALRQLRDNPAWQCIVASRIQDACERHLLGISDRAATQEQRTQHLEAYHLAKELEVLVPERIAMLERELAEFSDI
jgi:hypothetical protein